MRQQNQSISPMPGFGPTQKTVHELAQEELQSKSEAEQETKSKSSILAGIGTRVKNGAISIGAGIKNGVVKFVSAVCYPFVAFAKFLGRCTTGLSNAVGNYCFGGANQRGSETSSQSLKSAIDKVNSRAEGQEVGTPSVGPNTSQTHSL